MKVIARTNRGLEAGEVLAEATPEAQEQLKDAPGGQIFRQQTLEDINDLAHIHAKERSEFETGQMHVERLQMDMQLVDVEHLFGGERIVIYYVSEDRVDFRDLVKALAGEFQTRIELRQIGVRDEAKLLADYGDCGKPVCCNTHLHQMPPVSMKMAKLQKATLDPTKISGRCGRLKCCLRYEFDTYEELQRDLPAPGADVVTKNGRARVLGQEILSQQLLVAMEDNRRVLIPVADVLTVLKSGGQRDHFADGTDESSPPEGAPREGRSDRPPRGGSGGRPPRDAGRRPQPDRRGPPPRRQNEPPPNASETPPAAAEPSVIPPPEPPASPSSNPPPSPPLPE
jgi:cell fate regulator YaaT (PSP1 superfamily)